MVAAVRNPASGSIKELQGAYPQDQFAVVTMDYSSHPSIQEATSEAAKVLPNGLDYLINNAGVSLQESATFDEMYDSSSQSYSESLIQLNPLPDSDLKVFEEELRVNTIAPIEVVRSSLPLVRKGTAKKLVFLTSILASLDFVPDVAT